MTLLPAACLVACLSVVSAWNECAFPDVDWFALDEGVGISASYALAAMNGKMYSGGYTKGNFAFVGISDGADVNPNPSATLWGDTTSDVQSLYVAEVASNGSMTMAWLFRGSALQVGQIGHGAQTNSIDTHSGLHAMLDGAHIAVKGGFRQLLYLPDGTLWSSASRINTNDQVPFVMSLDVSSTQGIGAGTTGWAKLMDDGHAGGATVYSVDGDTNGDMIVTYEGCSGFNATATSRDAYGQPIQGAMTGCAKYVTKLAAANGTELWKHGIPTSLSACRTITDGSFFCGWSMRASGGTLDFGNGITVVSEAGKVGIVKFDAYGTAQWAKATASSSFGDLAVSRSGTLLAVVGSAGGYGSAGILSRINTSNGNEGNVLWSDAGGVGSHGFRGVEVTDDDTQVFAFGQLTGTESLSDTNGITTTLRSRGSYEVFVVAYNAADGSGRYAVDGGGTGMEYMFAMASDPATHDIYIGGYTRSEYITWGDVTRRNVMYNGQPGLDNPDRASAVGSSKALVVKLRSTLSPPSCLTTCNAAFPLQASDVRSGYCYIDRHCYANGASAPYSGAECTKCDAAVNKLAWSAPDTSAACFIRGTCVASGAHAQVRQGRSTVDDPCNHCDPSVSTSAYSPVACIATLEANMATLRTNLDTATASVSADVIGRRVMTGNLDLTMSSENATAMIATFATDPSVSTTLRNAIATGLSIDNSTVQITGVSASPSGGRRLTDSSASVVQVDYRITVSQSTTLTATSITSATEALKNAIDASMTNYAVTAVEAPMPTDATVTLTNTSVTVTAPSVPTDATVTDATVTDATVTPSETSETCGISDTLAIVLISVVSIMFLTTSVTLCILISKEKKGYPVFAPGNTQVVTGTPCSSSTGNTEERASDTVVVVAETTVGKAAGLESK